MKCLNCGKEIEQTVGKRQKQFCNSTCRSNYWQKQQVLKKGKIVSAKVVKENGQHKVEIKIEISKNQERINQLEYELYNPPSSFTSPIARKCYFFDRQKELKTLKS